MKTVAILLVLAAAAYAQFFCPDSEAEFECFETQPNTAYCLANTTWVCGKCNVKRADCFGNVKQATYESTCTNAGNAEISC